MLEQESPAVAGVTDGKPDEAAAGVDQSESGGQMGNLYTPDVIAQARASRLAWESTTVAEATQRLPERDNVTTQSGMPIKRLYTPEDSAGARLRA